MGYFSQYTGRQVSEALGRAVSSVQSVNGDVPDEFGNIDIEVPARLSDLENDEGFIGEDRLSEYAKSEDVAADIEDAKDEVTAQIPSVIDDVVSTDADNALSAYQGKLLNDRINNLRSIGRFLALWDCTTGLPLTNPSGYPYQYHTGDYFRVARVGTTNYMPNGASYQGTASTTVYSGGDVTVGDIWFYDGSSWALQINHAVDAVRDVNVDGASVVSDGVANITGLASKTWVEGKGYLTLSDLPIYNGGVS